MDTAAKRYLSAIHWVVTGVSYTVGGERKFAKKVHFFHTQGWGGDEVIAAIKDRHPTWDDIDLIVPTFVSPKFGAVIPTRDLDLEAEYLADIVP